MEAIWRRPARPRLLVDVLPRSPKSWTGCGRHVRPIGDRWGERIENQSNNALQHRGTLVVITRRTFLKLIGVGGAAAIATPLLSQARERICDCGYRPRCGENISALFPGEGRNVLCFYCASAKEINHFLFTKGLRPTPWLSDGHNTRNIKWSGSATTTTMSLCRYALMLDVWSAWTSGAKSVCP